MQKLISNEALMEQLYSFAYTEDLKDTLIETEDLKKLYESNSTKFLKK